MSTTRILVPIEESRTLRQTIDYVADTVTDEPGAIVRLVYVPSLRVSHRDRDGLVNEGERLLNRVSVWLEQDLPTDTDVTIETSVLSRDEPLYSLGDVADLLVAEATEAEIDHVVFDPTYDPGRGADMLHPIRQRIAASGISVETAPTRPAMRIRAIPSRADIRRFGMIFGLSFVFYQLLAGGISPYSVTTGAITAALVTATLGAVALWQPPALVYTPARIARSIVYIPYLLIMIVRANISVARVILHPRLPIDPSVVRYRPAVYGPFPITTLANSITLTPGTLSMRFVGQELLVHTLIPAAREDLESGRLERAVRFLFYGRRGMRVPSPVERGDMHHLSEPPEGDET